MSEFTERQMEVFNEAIRYCDEHDKSTEFMIQIMIDHSGEDWDTVIEYLNYLADQEDEQETK